jgi:hypothetical protein
MYPTSYKGEITSNGALQAVPLYSAPATVAPTKISPTVVTSAPARNDVTTANKFLDNTTAADSTLARAKAMQAETQAQIDAQNAAKLAKDKTYQTVAAGANADLSGGKVKGEFATAQEAKQAQYSANVQKVQRQMDQLQANMDARTSATIQNIKDEYDILVKEQEQANKAFEGGVTTAGFVSGRARYAPEIQMGMVTSAVNQGIQQISKVQQKRAQLINEAEAARDERNYKLLSTKMDLLRQNYKDEQDLAFKMLEEVRSADKSSREEADYYSKQLAPSISSMMTGDDQADSKTIQEAAASYGISPQALIAAMDTYSTDQSKAFDTSDIKEFNFALSRGELPQGTSFLEWQRQNANLKLKKEGIDVSQKGEQAWGMYGNIGQKAIADGASPNEAVMAMAAVADAAGVKLDLATQTELLDYVKALQAGNNKTVAEGTEAQLPGETTTGGELSLMEEFANLFSPNKEYAYSSKKASADIARKNLAQQYNQYYTTAQKRPLNSNETTAVNKIIAEGKKYGLNLNPLTK